MPPTRPLTLLTAGALTLTLGLAACGDDDASTDGASTDDASTETVDGVDEQTSTDDGAAAADAIEILDFTFTPESTTVAAGTELTFTNMDGAAHTATARDGSFNTEEIAGGAEASVTLDTPGEFTYFSAFHPFMEGTVVVE